MKRQIKNIFILSFFVMALVVGATSCSEWNDVESVEITEPDVEKDHPELWAKYLEALREYKQRDHKYVYGFFDNTSKEISSRGQSITSVPDSVDFIVMMYPDNLVELELKDMDKVREKGTKVIYEISYLTLEADWKLHQESIAPEAVEEDGDQVALFETFTKSWMTTQIGICSKYNYDGFAIFYKGKELTHSTPEQIAEYTAQQQAFLNPVIEWKAANADKTLVFEGYPHNVINKAILQDCKHIIIPTEYLASVEALEAELRRVIAEGVPTDRFIVRVFAKSLDPADKETGYFTTGNAILESAYWISVSDPDFTKAGMAILNISNGYYNPIKTYQNTRESFGIMN